jgi:hypothetical protein
MSGVVPLLMIAGGFWFMAGDDAAAPPEFRMALLPPSDVLSLSTQTDGAASFDPGQVSEETVLAGQSFMRPVVLSSAARSRSPSRLQEVERASDIASAARAFARERNCLAQAIYFEARGESLMGQSAVAEVVLNRVADPRYPKTICGTVFQNVHMKYSCQFSFACDDIADLTANVAALRIANRLADQFLLDLHRDQLTGTATHYHADYVMPYWAPKLVRVTKIGQHVFYRIPGRPPVSSGRDG